MLTRRNFINATLAAGTHRVTVTVTDPSGDPILTVTLSADHVFGKRRRLLFLPNRVQPELAFDEFRERDRHLTFGLTIKRSFGSASATAAPTE